LLEGVYFIPQLATNIVSIEQLDEVGYKIDIDIGVMKILEPRGLLLVRVKHEVNRLYLLHIKLVQLACVAVSGRGDEVMWHWHEYFGHINMVALRNLAREELVCDLPEIGQVEQFYEACQAGKQQHTTFPAKAEYCMRLVLSNCIGNAEGVTSTFCCSLMTSVGWVAMMPSKDPATAAIKEIQARVEGESDSTQRRTNHNRTTSLSAGMTRWWQLPEACSRPRAFPVGSRVKR
jgi:hypothetical protein